ncbi:MAG: c-type cytochrome [Flavitalea sp.]
MRYSLLSGLVTGGLLTLFMSCNSHDESDNSWKAPESADRLKSPDQHLSLMAQKGKETYDVYCWSCHGSTGFGDGAAGKSLGQRPANFHDKKIRRQSDGALFWKISHGRENMPSFEKVLLEEQRWQLVAYIRSMSFKARNKASPKPLNADIKVEHFMTVASQSVRILQHPLNGTLWYTTFDGDVYKIKSGSAGNSAEKILSTADHGIPRLQGAVFLDDTLYLVGNVNSKDNTATSGRMVCVDLSEKGNKKIKVIFTTVQYGANKTVYDHGWNAMEVSPDKKYIYVNSGARTDHGEVQDNGGMYPGARDNGLTSKIFRFPVGVSNLLLTDSLLKLKADGYLYAEGVRNVYDLAFDDKSNLFGVSNSPDYDMPEDMFWLREHHHYGFPWMAGGIENPQQFPDWDPKQDPFISKSSHAWEVRYFHNDPTFPGKPAGVKFSPGVQNLGPDANEYRGHTGKVLDGDTTGIAVSTFTAHCCPVGLCFDTHKRLAGNFKGDGFVIRYSLGARSSMMKPFTSEGGDLLHLEMSYDSAMDNYFVKTRRIVEGFIEPTDAILVGNTMYIIEYGGMEGDIWKLTFPADKIPGVKKTAEKK